ncbi:MAG TPA: response regulator [Nitrospira sp.]|nr:response regulator [Nitrospira sp.]
MPTILIVDDDQLIREFLRIVLEENGYQVAEADSGKAAILYLEQVEPSLIILDMCLGDMNGLDILPYVHLRCQSAKILAISGRPFDGYKMCETAKVLGAHDALMKPFDVATLVQRVAALLAQP